MKKIVFVCHGNICRSPMAEFIFKDYVQKMGSADNFIILSKAVHDDALGWPVHRETARILNDLGIDCKNKRAEKLTKEDYDKFDMFIGMDEYNRRDMIRLFDGDKLGKVSCLLDFAGETRDISDPWWTGDFTATYNDVVLGITALYKEIMSKEV